MSLLGSICSLLFSCLSMQVIWSENNFRKRGSLSCRIAIVLFFLYWILCNGIFPCTLKIAISGHAWKLQNRKPYERRNVSPFIGHSAIMSGSSQMSKSSLPSFHPKYRSVSSNSGTNSPSHTSRNEKVPQYLSSQRVFRINKNAANINGNLRAHSEDGAVLETRDSSSQASALQSTPLLDKISSPRDLKKLSVKELSELANEVRWNVIHSVSQTGGHLSASLGVVEVTLALHYVFNTPDDRLVWDVSHQAYPHKIITGRRFQMGTVRQQNGLSGFCRRSESEYDCFGAGHSSTSISAAQGFAVGRQLLSNKNSNHCIAVIGDGAITGGMAFEAMNYIGHLRSKVLVILNDNGQVSLPTGSASAGGTGPTGALSSYTARLLTSHGFQNFREAAKRVTKLFPEYIQETAAKLDEFGRGIVTGGTLFEELGFYYVGPLDGHDIEGLVAVLKNIKESGSSKPVLLHIKTDKGFGYDPAMAAADKMHGVVKFDVVTGKQRKSPAISPSLTKVFSDTLIDIAAEDKRVVAVTAAMPGGTGVSEFGKHYPDRTFDVGIAEQHAVTFCGGLALEGLKPFCCIYSTFLQRAYDQVIHDVVLQQLPVRFILDRAGMVGADGATHQGSFDLAYLGTLPNIIIMSPSDEIELMNMIQTAYETNDFPTAVRYPRGNGYGLEYLKEKFGYNIEVMPKQGVALEIGKGRIMRTARQDAKFKIAVLSLGSRLAASIDAAQQIESENSDASVTVADARFMRPLDIDLIRELAKNHDFLITIEEGAIGGFSSHVLHFMALDGLLENTRIKVRPLVLPDKFIEHGSQDQQYEEAGLTSSHISNTIRRMINKDAIPIVQTS
ncbi:1-deoxy-D-xylulose-5-phosphate synthase [Cardiosporidium cionae]|uniref:1-deoxy-D-xylulose-5-phosphate synthase n=1 Tax=Cardiosporidium cionae TaxID=476202 RepID=A0ABQ7JDW8_9APIC|nr:1-deoxy-D-xylulose-5-phosphate synthase [Cardiosporidium cionae]|eukprot:KAF8822193.1 1-deoxy-D-xylulose-5-phosphate synthase [Cardiosporidium cionae]